jgi:hypothetical protein
VTINKLVGELTLGKSQSLFNSLHPLDFKINSNSTALQLVDNGPKYSRYLNPYEQIVNSSMIEQQSATKVFSFKARDFYEKALELSQDPKNAKMDVNNPIYLHIRNPKDYRYYKIEGI